MDILKAEIAKKRKQLEDKALVTNERKFFKREELEQKQNEEYWKRQQEKQREKLSKSEAKTGEDALECFTGKSSEEITKMKLKQMITSSQTSESDASTSDDTRILPRKEVIKRLRDRCQPILTFGETEVDAFKRLRRLEILEPDSSLKGMTNDFQEAMEKVDAAYLEQMVKSDGSSTCEKKRGAHDVKFEEMNTCIDEILQEAEYLGKQRHKGSTAEEEQRKSDCDVILKFLKFLLELWGKKLNDRSEADKQSTQGKIATATYGQTQAYLKPLFKQLKKGSIAGDILKHLILIIKHMLDRNYVKASDAYLQMAIGNAPWPIGVTMVGIHARTGREKIFAQNIAHVLNDETQRKYIQGLKRLMTNCQKLFPTDPSRCVEYTKE